MRIKESKNLKCDKKSKVLTNSGDYDELEFQPRVCILENIERTDDTLILYFKNKTQATIRTHKIEGSREINIIEKKLAGLIGCSYEKILETEI